MKNINEFIITNGILKEYEGLNEVVTIPENDVTEISDYAFSCNSKVKHIIIPPSVKIIAPRAFHKCENLENIFVHPENKKMCDVDGVLFSKDKETLLKYPRNRTEKQYKIPEEVRELGNKAFKYCGFLKNIDFPEYRDGAICTE